VAERPNAIEVEDLHKSFRMPSHRISTFKERAVRPFTPIEYTTLQALRGISFQVAKGEFMGIAGRNGSGKTTLLKLLASIYRADRGQIRLAGTLAPFIELGVGFNANLTARENVLLNGVMMGLTPREARSRFDKVIEFAELEEFVEMKLKNYSTGMSIRLAFSVMVQSDADVLMVDEVLAVGDASFAQKCLDAFQELRDEGRTILLVTHSMESLRLLCDHAILIEDGVIDLDGDPADVANRYLEINFSHRGQAPAPSADGTGPGTAGKIAEVWLENSEGERPGGFEHGSPIHLVAVIEAEQEIDRPGFGFELCSTNGVRVFAAPSQQLTDTLYPGDRVTFHATVANPLVPGGYVINCGLSSGGARVIDWRRPAAELVVWGRPQFGTVELDWTWEVESQPRTSAMETARE
jgi:ABC-type polysaccharide/polyol phosphate transport system ATPase subunit